jgi:hypothetical protein
MITVGDTCGLYCADACTGQIALLACLIAGYVVLLKYAASYVAQFQQHVHILSASACIV